VADLASHARHDRFAVAEAVGGAGLPSTVRTCMACAVLHADLLAIRDAIRGAWIPSRPRDLRLTAADHARLRPSAWRRLLGAIGTSADSVTRPLGLTFTGLGLAGLLLTAIPVGSFGAATTDTLVKIDPEMYVAGAPSTPRVTGDAIADPVAGPTPDPADPDPLAVLSVGLLAAGGAVFGLRRVAPRAGAVR